MRNSLSLLGLVPLLAGSTFGQTGTDDCLSPTVLNGTGSWTWDNAAATTSGFDGGDSVACFSPANPAFDDGPYRDLFWAWTANADGDYTFDTEGSTGNTDTKLNVHFGGDCSATCVGSDDDSGSTPNRSSSFDVTGVQSGDTYLLQVGSWTASSPSGAGLLNIDFERCSVLGDDGFEDNDDCDQAVTIGNGTQPGLTVSKTDWDYYRILVPNGGVLSVDLDFVHLDGDIDAYLYDALVACATFADGDVGNLNSIDASASFDDDESLIWMNTTGLSRFVVVKVYVWPSTFSSDCNSYSMTVSGAFDPQAGLFCDPDRIPPRRHGRSRGRVRVLPGRRHIQQPWNLGRQRTALPAASDRALQPERGRRLEQPRRVRCPRHVPEHHRQLVGRQRIRRPLPTALDARRVHHARRHVVVPDVVPGRPEFQPVERHHRPVLIGRPERRTMVRGQRRGSASIRNRS